MDLLEFMMLIDVENLTEEEIDLSSKRAMNSDTSVAYLKNNGIADYSVSLSSIKKQIAISDLEE